MVNNNTVQAQVPTELKAQAEVVFESIGVKTSDTISLFLQQSVNLSAFPFQLKSKVPNTDRL